MEGLLMGELCTAKRSEDGYEAWTDEALQDHSNWLYEEYLNGEDYLNDLHRIAEILRSRGKP
jgi:hypothetical protein